MLHTVKKEQIDTIEGTTLIGEASTMGLRPGDWPEFIAVLDEKDEGFLFMRSAPQLTPDGELVSVHYIDRGSNFKLEVIND